MGRRVGPMGPSEQRVAQERRRSPPSAIAERYPGTSYFREPYSYSTGQTVTSTAIGGSTNGTNRGPKGVATQSGERQSQVPAPAYGSVGGISSRKNSYETILTTGNNQERFLVDGSA